MHTYLYIHGSAAEPCGMLLAMTQTSMGIRVTCLGLEPKESPNTLKP